MYLCFDSETSGFSQSRLLQLGAILFSPDHKPIMEASLLVRPDGWQIEEGATKVHGITNEFAAEHGLPLDVVLGIFCGLARSSTLFVGHNLEFDMRVITGELARLGWPQFNRPQFCTKSRSTNVCQFPPTEKMLKAGRRDYKAPKLIEAYRFAFGETFDGAHDAMADCRATARLYRWLMNPQPYWTTQPLPEDQFGQPLPPPPPLPPQ